MLSVTHGFAAVAAAAAIVCGVPASASDDLHASHGPVEKFAGKRVFAGAESNQLALYRYTVMFALLAEEASLNRTLDSNDIIALNLWLHRTDKDLFRAYRAVYPPADCTEDRHRFADSCWDEAPIYDGAIEDDLVHLAHYALPSGTETTFSRRLQKHDTAETVRLLVGAEPRFKELQASSGVVRSSDMTRALALATASGPAHDRAGCRQGTTGVLINRRAPQPSRGYGQAEPPADLVCVVTGVDDAQARLQSSSYESGRLVDLAPWGYDIMYHGVLHACDRLRARIDRSPDGRNVVTINDETFCQFYYSNMRLEEDGAVRQPDLFGDFSCFPKPEFHHTCPSSPRPERAAAPSVVVEVVGEPDGERRKHDGKGPPPKR
ncbi:MAG: hypothetical protein JSR45_15640 [Proteobacteria bacterium]|nr:hypothetical protein [Pseudomonadota bacterium]